MAQVLSQAENTSYTVSLEKYLPMFSNSWRKNIKTSKVQERCSKPIGGHIIFKCSHRCGE
jgi:hypothetical protein